MTELLPFLMMAAFFGAVFLLPMVLTRWMPALWHRRKLRGRAAWASGLGLLPLSPTDAYSRIADADRPGLFRQIAEGRVLDAFQDHDLVVLDYAFMFPRPPHSRTTPMLEATSLVLARAGLLLPDVEIQPWQTKPPPPQVIARLTRPGALLGDLMKQVYATVATGDAVFDRTFRVQGQDSAAIQAMISPRVRAIMLCEPRATFALTGRGLLVRARGIVPGADVVALMAMSRELLAALRAEQRSA